LKTWCVCFGTRKKKQLNYYEEGNFTP